jgi:hypothetical protein
MGRNHRPPRETLRAELITPKTRDRLVRFAAIAVASVLTVPAQGARASEAVVAGWIERVSLTEKSLVFDAKLDTGADSSSLNGRDIVRFRRGGRPFARFMLTDDGGRTVRLEAPVVRVVRIKRAGADSHRRVAVRLKVCVAGLASESDFTLADRDDLAFQVLIGRNVLAGRIMVDSGRERIVSDRCGPAR